MPEDDNLSIILGRTFLNTAGAVIDCTKSKVTFKVEGKEHTIYFPRKPTQELQTTKVNTVKVMIVMVGSIEITIPPPPSKYEILMIGSILIKYKLS